MAKKILFTIQWYPSVLSANALCDENVIRALNATGDYDITCLVYSTPETKTCETIEGVKVIRFRKGLLWDAVIKAKKEPTWKHAQGILRINRIIQRIKQLFLIPIYPIFEPIAILKFAKKAIHLHSKEHFDMVISEHNGIDSLMAGFFLKRKDSRIKYIPIFWDPLHGKEAAKYLPRFYSMKKQKRLEKRILQFADKAVFMESMKAFHDNNGIDYIDKGVYLSFPKLVKPSNISAHNEYTKKGMINIVYSGILNLPDRDPSRFLDLLSRSSYAKRINLIFFCTGSGRSTVEEFSHTFLGNVMISSYIPVDTLKSVYQSADVLLNIGGPNPNMVPSKVYDYMSSCRPIVSTYYIDNESSKSILERYPAALLLDLRAEAEANVSLFDEFIAHLSEYKINFGEIESRYIKNSPQCYVELFKEID